MKKVVTVAIIATAVCAVAGVAFYAYNNKKEA